MPEIADASFHKSFGVSSRIKIVTKRSLPRQSEKEARAMTLNHDIGGTQSQAQRPEAARSVSGEAPERTGPRPADNLLIHLGKQTVVVKTPEEMARILHSATPPKQAEAFAVAEHERASWGNDEDRIVFWRHIVTLLSSNGRKM